MQRRKIFATALVLTMVLTSMIVLVTDTSENARAAPDSNEPTAFKQVIGDMLGNVSGSKIYSTIWDLTNFTTRFYSTVNHNNSGQYIHDYFTNYSSLFIEDQYLDAGGVVVRNIIATLPGFNPTNNSVYVIGGHYDSVCYSPPICNSFNNPMDPAPGADDDASGTAVAMEAARVMSEYKFNATLVFAAWTAEEIGLVGSDYYARTARESGMNIDGMLQFDMIGNDPNGLSQLNIITNFPSEPLADEFIAANIDYGLGLNIAKSINPGSSGSDHASFWAYDYPAILAIEEDFSANYHLPSDNITNINITFIEKIVKAGIASAAGVAGILTPGVGELVLDKKEYKTADTVQIKLYDTDLNVDTGTAETTTVTAISDTEPAGESVILTETGLNTSVFIGSIPLTLVPAVGELEVAHGDGITVTYIDASPPGFRNATAIVDDVPPTISNVAIVPGAVNAVVTWDTDERADSEVFYNTSVPLDNTRNDTEYVTEHSVEIMGLMPSTKYLLDVASSDPAGNLALDDNNGLHYAFETLSGTSATPQYGYIGYVQSDEPTGNHFYSERIIVGHSDFTGRIYVGGAQLDTSLMNIPPAATITNATMSFYGRQWVYEQSVGLWNLRMLHSSIDTGWTTHTYADITGATVNATIQPTYSNPLLNGGEWTTFWFNPVLFPELRARVNSGKISFRIDGPTMSNLIFDWSTGFTDGGDPLPKYMPRFTVSYSLTGDNEGPQTSNVVADPNPTWGANHVTLTATVSDALNGSSNISTVEYFVDADPGIGKGIPMSSEDGAFDSVTENARMGIDVSGWSTGPHNVGVRGRDNSANWGPAETIAVYKYPADDTPPEITNVMAQPSPQQIFGNVNITANVTDAYPVAVWVNVTMPDSTSSNTTMTQNIDEYFHDMSYSQLGVHDFVIWASDLKGNWNSSGGQFEIVDTILPSMVVSVNPAIQEIHGWVNISAVIDDTAGIYDAWINISMPGPSWLNTTMDRYSPTDFFRNDTYDVLGTYNFVIWTNDTSGNWNSTIGSFDIVDTTLPAIANLQISPATQEVTLNVNVSADITDNDLVSGAWINITFPDGTSTNTSLTMGTGNSYYLDQSYTTLGDYTFTIWAADPTGNWNSVTGGFTIVDTILPLITDVLEDPNPQELDGNVNVTANITDSAGIVGVFINIEGEGNFTMSLSSGNRYFYEATYDNVGTYNYVIWTRDASGNWNSASSSFVIQDSTNPVAMAGSDLTVDVNSTVFFDGSASSDNSGTISSYTWTITLDGNPIDSLTGASASYTFTTAGNYTVTLEVIDPSGNTHADTMTVTVRDTAQPPPPPPEEPPAEPEGFDLWWLIIVIIIVVVVILLLLLMRRKKPLEEEAPVQEVKEETPVEELRDQATEESPFDEDISENAIEAEAREMSENKEERIG
jgi:hypothetical protein